MRGIPSANLPIHRSKWTRLQSISYAIASYELFGEILFLIIDLHTQSLRWYFKALKPLGLWWDEYLFIQKGSFFQRLEISAIIKSVQKWHRNFLLHEYIIIMYSRCRLLKLVRFVYWFPVVLVSAALVLAVGIYLGLGLGSAVGEKGRKRGQIGKILASFSPQCGAWSQT